MKDFFQGNIKIETSITQISGVLGMLFVMTNPYGVIIPQFYDEVGLTSALAVLAAVAGWDAFSNLSKE